MVEEIAGPSELTETKWIKLKTKNPICIAVTYGHQENTPIDKVENQYQELTTDTIRHQQNNDVIIMGDLNSKIKILKNTCQQQTSRNGKLLEEFIKQTQTTIINTKPEHKGTWTRENRTNPNEKSIIDYLITSNNISKNIIESETDNNNIHPITGSKRTDHNIITAKININEPISKNKTTRWKNGSKEEWKKYNTEVEKIWNQTPEHLRTYTKLKKTITTSMEKTIGKITISNNNNKKTKKQWRYKKHEGKKKKTKNGI